jgi:hypothetical protein
MVSGSSFFIVCINPVPKGTSQLFFLVLSVSS